MKKGLVNKRNHKRDLEFLYEMGCLRHIDRTWVHFGNTDFQNLSEHHLRVIWIALVLASREKVKNTEKIMKLALMHDIAESRTGDVDYLSRQYTTRNEDLGMQHILADTSLKNEFLALWEEYKKKETIESRIVKDADMLDVDLELKEQEERGSTLRKLWQKGRTRFVAKHLYTKSAKALWKKIQTSNPNDWHAKANSMLNEK